MKAIVMTEPTTHELLDHGRAGDREAFEAFCREHGDRLTAQVSRSLGAELRARLQPEDVVQETFLRAFESVGLFRGNDQRRSLSFGA